MSLFKDFDIIIKESAEKLEARLTIDRPLAPKSFHPFEERRIDWEEGGMNKAIIIQPHFGSTGVDTSLWSLKNIAWIVKKGIAQKPGWRINLIDKQDFYEIESNIDELLIKSIQNLKLVEYGEVEKLIRKRK